MKKIRFRPNVQAEIRAIEQKAALHILEAIDSYARTAQGRVKPLSGEFEGLLRLGVGKYRIFFEETEDTTVHRVRDSREASAECHRDGVSYASRRQRHG